MGKRLCFVVILMTAMLLSGCVTNTLDDLYCLPERSEDYNDLQSAISSAMVGLEYCAPVSGENQQTVQMADLDGDGTMEYLLFAKGVSENPLKILIFREQKESYTLWHTISFPGTSFDQVEYVPMDGVSGVELIVGRQVSDQVLGSVSVYSFGNSQLSQIMTADYKKYLVTDLDGNNRSELLVLRSGEGNTWGGTAQIFCLKNGQVEYSQTAAMSQPVDALKRIIVGKMHAGVPAVYVASTVGDHSMITDVYAMVDGAFVNVTCSNESGTSVQTLRDYYVYATDIDSDGVIELPDLMEMHRDLQPQSLPNHYLIRWYAMTATGQEVDKLFTYHNFAGGWYLEIDSSWTQAISVTQYTDRYEFHLCNEEAAASEKIMTIFVLRGADREEMAKQENRFVLYRGEDVIYAASLEVVSTQYGISTAKLIDAFHLIHQDWKTGET